jgi:uncharacterized protein (TIGR01777 family)
LTENQFKAFCGAMKIVLTGGTGLVGNALGQALVKQGHQLHVLARSPDSARTRLSYPCTLWSWKEGTPVPAEPMTEADIVIHLAGENVASQRWTQARKRALRDSRIKTADALAAAIQTPLQAFISASGTGLFGDRGDELLHETSAPGDDFLAQLCVEWEAASEKVPAARHLQMRFGVILSAQGGFLSAILPVFRLGGASRLGSGRQFLSWIHIDDVVAVLKEAVNNPEMNGPYNVVAPNPETNAQVTKLLQEALHESSAPAVPNLALKVLYGELSTALLGSQRASPQRLSRQGFRFKYPELKDALAAIYPGLQAGELQSVFELWVPGRLNVVWEFFASERNLENLAPPSLNFKVVGISTPKIQVGTLLDYRLKIRGMPVRWRTEITEWQPPRRFADQQLKGPYNKWHHVHQFEELGEGVLIKDTIRWRLPMGRLGRLAALSMVLRDLAEMFRYRAEVIGRIFFLR